MATIIKPTSAISRDFCIAFITCKSKKEADAIAVSLLKRRLAACVNTVSNINSKFWWDGKIEKAKEVLVILKTRRRNFKKIEEDVRRLHSYEVPEIIAVPLVAGSRDYLRWIRKETI